MEQELRPFTSSMEKWQYLAVLLYLPVHVFGLPLLLTAGYERGYMTIGMANFWLYAVGAVLMVLLLWGFLRRELDPLLDRPFAALWEILRSYLLIWCAETGIALLLSLFGLEADAANNRAAIELLRAERGPMIAASVFLAPIVEECLFRGGLFGLLRGKNRTAAYLVSALAFGLYHVLAYAAEDPLQLLYVLEYLPAGLLLARCYERTDCLWSSMLLHGFCNGISFWMILHG